MFRTKGEKISIKQLYLDMNYKGYIKFDIIDTC